MGEILWSWLNPTHRLWVRVCRVRADTTKAKSYHSITPSASMCSNYHKQCHDMNCFMICPQLETKTCKNSIWPHLPENRCMCTRKSMYVYMYTFPYKHYLYTYMYSAPHKLWDKTSIAHRLVLPHYPMGAAAQEYHSHDSHIPCYWFLTIIVLQLYSLP